MFSSFEKETKFTGSNNFNYSNKIFSFEISLYFTEVFKNIKEKV